MSEYTMNMNNAVIFLGALFILGCGASEVRPVELFPEDECANCRMSVSDPKYASQIITEGGEVLKYDDLSCLEKYRKDHAEAKIAAIFVKDFESTQWLRYENSIIVQTGIETPMGSGKVAVSSNDRATAVRMKFPAEEKKCDSGCCGS